MIKGKLVVVSNLTTFKTIQQSSDPIPDSAIVFIKNEGQIWTKGSYFGVQKTYDVVSKTDAGLAPKGGDSASSQIANVDDEWVLTVTNGANPSWRKLPANAFKNQTYTFYNLAFKNSSGTTVDTYKPSTSPSKNVKAGTNVKISASSNTITISATDTTYNAFTGASDSVDGSQGLVPKPTKGNQSKFLKADGSWATPTDTTYPIVSSTKDGLVPKFDANDGTIDQQDKDWVLTNNNGSIGWYKLPTNAFNNSTYSLVNSSSNGLVPILPTTNSTTISTQADEWVLTTTKGGEPSWRKLPTTAFYSLPTAKTNALGGIKVGSVSTSAFADLTGKYYTVNVDKNGVAYVNVPWTDTPYTLPTASSTLGGVKTTSTVSSTTGLTACPIIDGVVYYKDSDSNTWRGIYVGGTSKMGTANNTKALNFAAGNNVTISYAAPGTASGQSGNASYGTLTINATNTWTAWSGATSSANGTAGYMPAPTSAQRNQFLRGDGTWQSLNNYSLPTASSSTLGGVKTGAAITDTTGYTPVHIKDGVIYYKDTNSTEYLSLKGGTLDGNLIINSSEVNPLKINYTGTDTNTPSYIYYSVENTKKAGTGYYKGLAYVANETTSNAPRIGVTDAGIPQYWDDYAGTNKYTLLHTGNYTTTMDNRYIKKQGDTVDGTLTSTVTSTTLKAFVFSGTEFLDSNGNINLIDTAASTSWNVIKYSPTSSTPRTFLLTVLKTGNVGIGTINPTHKLHVNGGILSTATVRGTTFTSTGVGSGTYNVGAISTNTTCGLEIEAPLKADSYGHGETYPITFSWRGGYANRYGMQLFGGGANAYLTLTSSKTSIKFFAWDDGCTYIESGNTAFTANANLNITGIGGNTGSDLWLNMATIYCRGGKYVNIDSGNWSSYISTSASLSWPIKSPTRDLRHTEIGTGGDLVCVLDGATGFANGISAKNSAGVSYGTAAGLLGNNTSLDYYYYGGTYDSPKAVILPNGNMGIGDKNPAYKLEVAGSLKSGSIYFMNGDSAQSVSYMFGMYQWGNEVQFTKRNLSNVHQGTCMGIDLTSGVVNFDYGIKIGGKTLTFVT